MIMNFSSLIGWLLILTPLPLINLLISLLEVSSLENIIRSIILIFPFNWFWFIEIEGNSEPSEFSENVFFAVSSLALASSSPCNIDVALLARVIFNWLISLSLLFSISSTFKSVKILRNLKTSLSSVFLQNCQ